MVMVVVIMLHGFIIKLIAMDELNVSHNKCGLCYLLRKGLDV